MIANFILTILFTQVFHIPLVVWFFCVFGVIFSIQHKFYHIKKITSVVKYLQNNNTHRKTSAFGVLMSLVGGVLGMGNIIGGCMSVKIAGPGVLFWIPIVCIVCSAIKFQEAFFSIQYKKKNPSIPSGNVAFFYIKQNRGKIGFIVSLIYIFFFIFAYGIDGIIQANQVISLFHFNHNYIVNILISIISFYLLFDGIDRLSLFMSKIVPFMFLSYTGTCILSIILSGNLSQSIGIIIHDAFSPKSASIGFLIGYAIQRICFASDVGTGLTGTIITQGKIQDPKLHSVLGVFEIMFVGINVFITGLTIVCSNINISSLTGINIIIEAIKNVGNVGVYLVSFDIMLFGLTTICICGYLSQKGILSLSQKNYLQKGFLVIYSLGILISSKLSFDSILTTLDVFLIICGIINILTIFNLKRANT